MFIFLTQDKDITHTETGSIKCINESLDQWEIELQFLFLKPFRSRKLSIANIPDEFKEGGLKVRCDYIISDVTGSSEWDTYIKVINISKARG